MAPAPSRAVRLFGTDEAVAPSRLLRAGLLSASLDAGNLRHICFGATEVLRAISFVVRDRDWGTYAPLLADLLVEEGSDRFVVIYRARVADAEQDFAYEARIEGAATGRVTFAAHGASKAGFVTNRTGFVVLHPIVGVAGEPVTVTHVDGHVVEARFPALIEPAQPMMGLRALAHTAPGGLRVTCLMEGDTFEMEDQRNWTDASYKTYVRPLARPWPYRLEPGEVVSQRVMVTIEGEAATAEGAPALRLAPGPPCGSVPPLGQGLDPDDADAALGQAPALRALGLSHLILRHDVRRGHSRASLERQLAVARAMGADPWLEAVIEAPDDEGAATEVAALGALSAALGHPFTTVLVSPAPDLKCTLPGSTWPPAPDAARLYATARAAFGGARIGGGMFSFFTELNRKRPPQGLLDLVGFTTSPLVHAGDDLSVMESREAHPAIAETARAIAQGTPWSVGPSAIGMRDNPYGAAPKANPGNVRQAMNLNDPRQRGLLGAAWALSYFADFAYGGAAAVALGAPVGAFGTVAVRTSFPQPWYEGREEGGLYPVYHVLRGLAALRGRTLRRLDLPAGSSLAGLAADGPDGPEMWIANMGLVPVTASVPGDGWDVALLDAASFEHAARAPDALDRPEPLSGGAISLDSFAVARIRAGRAA